MTKTVAILQEFIPAYRADFFTLLNEQLSHSKIRLEVYAGGPSSEMSDRGDATSLPTAHRLRQIQARLFGYRITLRLIPWRALTADLLIVEQARRNIEVFLMLLIFPKRIAVWGHGTDRTIDANRLRTRLLAWMTRRSRHLFIYTEPQHSVGDLHCNITVVNNSKAEPAGASQVRDHMPTTPTVSFIGAIDRSKDLTLLLEATDLVAAEVPDFRLDIIGSGPDEQWLAAESARRSYIKLLGRRTGQELSDALMDAKLIAIPGRVGLVAVDSMFYGRPIVTTDHERHAPEFSYLTNGKSCFTTARDATSYARTMIGLLGDDRRLREAGQSCASLRNVYSLEEMVHRFATGISDVLDA